MGVHLFSIFSKYLYLSFDWEMDKMRIIFGNWLNIVLFEIVIPKSHKIYEGNVDIDVSSHYCHIYIYIYMVWRVCGVVYMCIYTYMCVCVCLIRCTIMRRDLLVAIWCADRQPFNCLDAESCWRVASGEWRVFWACKSKWSELGVECSSKSVAAAWPLWQPKSARNTHTTRPAAPRRAAPLGSSGSPLATNSAELVYYCLLYLLHTMHSYLP